MNRSLDFEIQKFIYFPFVFEQELMAIEFCGEDGEIFLLHCDSLVVRSGNYLEILEFFKKIIDLQFTFEETKLPLTRNIKESSF